MVRRLPHGKASLVRLQELMETTDVARIKRWVCKMGSFFENGAKRLQPWFVGSRASHTRAIDGLSNLSIGSGIDGPFIFMEAQTAVFPLEI